MGLADTVRAAVAVADRVTGGTGGLQVTVTHKAWSSQDGDGKPTYAAGVSRSGVLVYETKAIRGVDGHERQSIANLTFIGNVAVDIRDQITLPDGKTPVILRVSAPADSGTAGAVFITQVWFG
jgi:hypothetical protein